MPSPLTPKTTTPPAIETPNLRSAPARSRSTITLPSTQAVFAPQETGAAVLSAAAAFIQNSIVKSPAPTSAGGPGFALAGSSTGILTRSTSGAPLPWKRSEDAADAAAGANASSAASARDRRTARGTVGRAP